MNIVLLNDYAFVNGGASQVALSSARALCRRGHRVTLFAPVGPADPELHTTPGLRVICLDQHDILSDPNRLRALTRGLWNFQAATSLRGVLKNQDPENTILHVHGWTKALTSSVFRAAAQSGYRVVLTLHDFFAACPNGAFFNFPQRRTCQLVPLSLKCMFTRCDARSHAHKCWRVLRQIVQGRLGRVPAGLRDFIAISGLSSQIMAPHLPPGARLYRLSNPIDACPQEPVTVESNHRFLAVGRLAPEKGPDLLASAAERSGIPATFVGDGEMRDQIRSLNPGATITGWLSRAQVQSQLASARALVLPSRCYETQGLVVLEAAALGIPAIVPSACAASEVVEHGVTGLWFQSGDAADLERCMRRMLDADFARKLGRAAHRRFWQLRPTLDEHADKLETIYRSILGLHSSPSS